MLGRLRNKIARKYYKSFYKHRISLSNYRGLKLLLRPANHLDRLLKRGIPFESTQLDFVLGEIQAHGVDWFIDVGANLGLYSLTLAKRAPSLRQISAFEAQVENFNQLCGNIFLNGMDRKIEAHNIGVSDRQGMVTFLRNVGSSTGTSRIQETAPDSTKLHRFEEEQLPVSTLDALLGPVRQRCLFMKIDVEGHELKVLAGARETLRNNRCLLQVELLDGAAALAEKICAEHQLEQYHRIGDDHYFRSPR